MENKILDEAKVEAEELLQLLIEGSKLFPKELVPKALLGIGYTYYKGVVVPLSSISYKILYDGYEVSFLEGYISMFRKILEENDSISNEFSFRTLLEMGSENSFFLLSPQVEKDDKKLFTLLSLLADYSSIETSMRLVFYDWFNKLYNEYEIFLKSNLSENDVKILEEMRNLLKESSPDLDKYGRLLKGERQLFSKAKSDLLNKYARKKIFQLSDGYKRMKSGEAHMLHGNAFLILNRMSQQSQENHLFRVFAYLTISGVDLLNRLSEFLGNEDFSKKVEEFNEKHNKFKVKFSSAWGETQVKT